MYNNYLPIFIRELVFLIEIQFNVFYLNAKQNVIINTNMLSNNIINVRVKNV